MSSAPQFTKVRVRSYVYVSFDVLPFICFRNDFAIEGSSGVGHLEWLFESLIFCSFFLI